MAADSIEMTGGDTDIQTEMTGVLKPDIGLVFESLFFNDTGQGQGKSGAVQELIVRVH